MGNGSTVDGRMRWRVVCVAAIAAGMAVSSASAAEGGGSVVRLVRDGEAWGLVRNGKPYLIRGAGGSGYLPALAAAGGNSIRTWDAEGIDGLLDRADELGLTVTVGIWLGQAQRGFDYTDDRAVLAQLDRVRKFVLRYRGHPALLMWGLGNEMEGDGSNAAAWMGVNAAAELTRRLDPDHPTMTVIAEMGGQKVRNLHRLCPAIDVVGINSYGGIASVPKRYRDAGGTKPYAITEFGPIGHWEVGKTDWGAPREQTSTDKARWYADGYRKAVLGEKDLCVGSYVFLWGHKQEATATWYGMFLPDGTRLGPVDAMARLWSGKPPKNLCPTITDLHAAPEGKLRPGATVKAVADVGDPEGDPLAVRWVLRAESGAYATGGAEQDATERFAGAVTAADANTVTLRMPKWGGGYRLFAYVRDGHGGGAVANLPLFVEGPKRPFRPPAAKLPLVLYDDTLENAPYTPSGWMGNTSAVEVDPAFAEGAKVGKHCMRCRYAATDKWAGVVWQSPPDDWGDRPGGFDLSKATKLTFWARGASGGEKVTFKLGILGDDKPYHDSATASSGVIALTDQWTRITLDLAGKDLSCIKTGFCWTVAARGGPVAFDLDDIRYE